MKIIKGEKIRPVLPENLKPKIEQAFKDFDLEMEKDLQECTLVVNEKKGSCFLMYKYVDNMNKGNLLCTFTRKGTGFTWGKPYLHYFDK